MQHNWMVKHSFIEKHIGKLDTTARYCSLAEVIGDRRLQADHAPITSSSERTLVFCNRERAVNQR